MKLHAGEMSGQEEGQLFCFCTSNEEAEDDDESLFCHKRRTEHLDWNLDDATPVDRHVYCRSVVSFTW